MRPTRARLDERRWHLQHGPIDLVIEADRTTAIELAWQRFQDVLARLVEELPLLRSAVQEATTVAGPVAQRMLRACWPYRDQFITPMAAVAGAVADEVMAAMREAHGLRSAYVNNGGDIALHLAPGESFTVGLVANVERIALDGRLRIAAAWPVRGIATSGWRGRSWSLGVADSVMVLAADAAAADAAATMIANEVNIDHPAISRARACDVDDDTDLGDRLVTVEVAELPVRAVDAALSRGLVRALELERAGLIWGAALALQAQVRVAGGIGRLEERHVHAQA